MDEFGERPLEEQRRLWLGLGRDVLRRWGLAGAELSWLGYGHNAVFKVWAGGVPYVLRMGASAGNADAGLEMWWLREIRRRTELVAPVPIGLDVDGEESLYVRVEAPGISPRPVMCCLFDYVDGASKVAAALTEADVRAIGGYLGALHSEGQCALRGDVAVPRLDWEGLFGEESRYHAPREYGLLTGEQREVFALVGARVGETMRGLDAEEGTRGLIHGDLLAKNVLFRAEGLAALDFEYCGWGYFLYDMAPLLWELKGERAEDYAALEEAMWDGYVGGRREWASGPGALEDFIAARQLASCRWLLGNMGHPHVRRMGPRLLRERTEALRGYLDSGVLGRKSLTL